MFSLLNRLSSLLRSGTRFSETLLRNDALMNNRSMCSKTTRRRSSKISLYSQIATVGGKAGDSVVPELEKWIENGRKVRTGELQRIIRIFRQRRRYSKALQVSEWMGNQGLCSFSPSDHAVRLDLIGHVHGLESAENYFNSLSDPDKTVKAYGALLNCYVRAGDAIRSLSLVQKMKDMGFSLSHLVYNDLMCLYTKIGEYEKVPSLLTEMKENSVIPDNFSYRICINSYGVKSDIVAMEKILEEMENQSHISMDWSTYAVVANSYMKAGLPDKATIALNKSEQKLDKLAGPGFTHLISLYASLGSKNDLLRLWNTKRTASKRHNTMDYIIMLGSLLKLGVIEEAVKLLKEYESSGNIYNFNVPNILLLHYSENGAAEKAEAMLEDLIKRGKTPIPSSWSIVAAAYAKENEMGKGVECMKKALSLSTQPGHEKWNTVPNVIASMLQWLGDQGEVEEVEGFVESLKTVMPMNRDMYLALLKAHLKGGKDVDGLLENMKADKIDADEEIEKTLSLRRAGSELLSCS